MLGDILEIGICICNVLYWWSINVYLTGADSCYLFLQMEKVINVISFSVTICEQ